MGLRWNQLRAAALPLVGKHDAGADCRTPIAPDLIILGKPRMDGAVAGEFVSQALPVRGIDQGESM
jgi:hypothetical protein